jgi:V-type H+-transporting ATPase subunit C
MSHLQPSVWMISAPSNPTKQETIQKLSDRLVKPELASIYPFGIQEFKVGTLDSLIVLSDELAKTDLQIETTVVKISDSLRGTRQG